MAIVKDSKNGFSVTAYRGDAKTLLAFNFDGKAGAKRLAGFTIQVEPQGKQSYFIQNVLSFEHPANHAQDQTQPRTSTINAPIHKFRWVHVPGSIHQGTKPFLGPYTYTVTPRYFDAKKSMLPLDPAKSVAVKIEVNAFEKQGLALGFTRGYKQSQAFVNHFGLQAKIEPENHDLIFDTSQVSGTNARGETFTYDDEYEWLGFTARAKLMAILDLVAKDSGLHADIFAYDLNETGFVKAVLDLAAKGRVRVILDDAALHKAKTGEPPTPEDKFEKAFKKVTGKPDLLKRGKFGRYAHDKVIVVREKAGGAARQVLTGSTNFSATGLYVNSNHVLVFDDPAVATVYAAVFDEAWADGVENVPFQASKFATQSFPFETSKTPKTEITFAPHDKAHAASILGDVAKRIGDEGKKGKTVGSVFFAVMQIDKGISPVYTALNNLHKNQKIFSYGISDSPAGISLFPVGKKTGVLVTGKPGKTTLPPPFNQVPNISGFGHQVHHKFVVCGFNTADAVVYCGSSNLALGGENLNGDNLLAIHDQDIATVFTIEALLLVDHFDFLDRSALKKKPPKASKTAAAANAGWFLSTDDGWTTKYFDTKDLHNVDRLLFG
jgi:phosphatidylserine/phosphatidylglycerophosphate/cardiolipin synthase-like enzyme